MGLNYNQVGSETPNAMIFERKKTTIKIRYENSDPFCVKKSPLPDPFHMEKKAFWITTGTLF